MGITRFLACLAVCSAALGCSAPPDDAARAYFNAESGNTAYPKLLNAPDLASANLQPNISFDENNLAARIAALRARAATLNGPVLTNAERRRLRQEAARL